MTNNAHNKEKEAIARRTAEIFLSCYNIEQKTTFTIIHMAGDRETPDAFCCDVNGNKLNLELRVFGDAPETPSFVLGHSTDPLKVAKRPSYSLVDDTLNEIQRAISKKALADYGMNVALVLRYVGGIWEQSDFERSLPPKQELSLKASKVFTKGVWVISTEYNIVRII
jgi:hypothetical protein